MASDPPTSPARQLTDAQRALVTLACRHCGFTSIPTLLRQRNDIGSSTQLGAYCSECKRWMKWVPQDAVWLMVEYMQLFPKEAPIQWSTRQWMLEVSQPGSAPEDVGGVRHNSHLFNSHCIDAGCVPDGTGESAPAPHVYRRKLYCDDVCYVCGKPASDPAHTAVTTQEEQWVTAIAEMAQFCYIQAGDLGFHDRGKRSVLELAMLVVTECAELAEWERHGRQASDHIPEFSGAEEEFADILIRVFDHALEPSLNIDPTRLGQAVVAKLAYNRTRGYRHGGKTI